MYARFVAWMHTLFVRVLLRCLEQEMTLQGSNPGLDCPVTARLLWALSKIALGFEQGKHTIPLTVPRMSSGAHTAIVADCPESCATYSI